MKFTCTQTTNGTKIELIHDPSFKNVDISINSRFENNFKPNNTPRWKSITSTANKQNANVHIIHMGELMVSGNVRKLKFPVIFFFQNLRTICEGKTFPVKPYIIATLSAKRKGKRSFYRHTKSTSTKKEFRSI